MELTNNECIVLLALVRSKKQDLTEKKVHYSFSLGEGGKEYAIKGLPEGQILAFVNKMGTQVSLGDVRSKFGKDLSGIALGWFRRIPLNRSEVYE